MDGDEIECALRAIVPSASPAQLMDAVVQHAVAASRADPHRKRRRATRRHGAYVRKRELEQSRLYNLPLDVIDLQRQIAQLEQLREMLAARTLNSRDAGDGSLVRTASVYYDVMARGFQDVVTQDHRRIDTRAYIAAAMREDVWIGRFCGRQNFVPMMQRYTAFFADNRLRLTSATVLAAGDHVVVRTKGQYSARLTTRTIEALFPHIIEDTAHAGLVRRLLARPLEGESTFDFVFDRASARVARFDADMNFLPAFLELVPDPEELAFLFSQAKISEEMFIGELDEFDASRSAACATDEEDMTSAGYTTAATSPSSPSFSDSEPCRTPSPPSVPRNLKMADLLSPECDDDSEGAVRMPALYM